jgi:hypothetical protein
VAESEFSLVKWYMDCVAAEGDAVILYCATLGWRGIRAVYSSVLSVHQGGVESHASMARHRLASANGVIDVEFARLKVSGQWRADAEPFERMVYKNAAGSVVWNCMQPRSRASVRVGERELSGLGYAECLTLTLPPWQLPMCQLRWGRFVSAEDSLAWVDWQGPHTTSFAVRNGALCDTVSVSDSEVVLDGATLRMEESFPLRSGRVDKTVLPGAPALRKLLPHSLFNIEEHKWRSRGVLQAADRDSRGWVIHEVVNWKL